MYIFITHNPTSLPLFPPHVKLTARALFRSFLHPALVYIFFRSVEQQNKPQKQHHQTEQERVPNQNQKRQTKNHILFHFTFADNEKFTIWTWETRKKSYGTQAFRVGRRAQGNYKCVPLLTISVKRCRRCCCFCVLRTGLEIDCYFWFTPLWFLQMFLTLWFFALALKFSVACMKFWFINPPLINSNWAVLFL